MMIRSLWRGLGRKTPAPKRSMSKRPAPVAIISIAQQASPKVVAHEDDRPWQEEDHFNVGYQEQHRDNVVAHREACVRAGYRINAALIRPHLVLLIFPRPQKSSQDQRQHRKGNRENEKDHDRQ